MNVLNPNEFAKLHPVAMLCIAPLLGATFVIFLPVLGFAMLGHTIFVAIKRHFNKLAHKSVPVSG